MDGGISEAIDGGAPRSADRLSIAQGALVTALCAVTVLPYWFFGAGFFLDDWRNLARLETVGWLRSAEASRFASRPGAWSVEMVTYPLLRGNVSAWLVALTLLNALVAVTLLIALRRFVAPGVALGVVVIWIVLPNHTSLRLFPNTAPILVALFFLLLAVVLFDQGRLLHGAFAVAAGGLCYEAVLVPGIAVLIALHLLRSRGARRDVWRAVGVIVGTGCLMLIHPTYSLSRISRGSPRLFLPGHFTAGLSRDTRLAAVLGSFAVVAVVAAVVRLVRRDGPTEGPWLVVGGLATLAAGSVGFMLKWPAGFEGQADRAFVLTAVGSAAIWVGGALTLVGGRRVVLWTLGLGFIAICTVTNVQNQRVWSTAAMQVPRMIEAVDCRFPDGVPDGLVIGPRVPVEGGVRAIHQFFVADATLVVLGRSLDFTLAESDAEFLASPPPLRLSWEELLSDDQPCSGRR